MGIQMLSFKIVVEKLKNELQLNQLSIASKKYEYQALIHRPVKTMRTTIEIEMEK